MTMASLTTSHGRKCSIGGKAVDRTKQDSSKSPDSSNSPDSSSNPDSSVRTGSSFLGVRLPDDSFRSAQTDEDAFTGSTTGAVSPTQGQSSGRWIQDNSARAWNRGNNRAWTRGREVRAWTRKESSG